MSATAPSAPSRLAWWQEARLGMSLHYGPYSVAGRGEWVRSVEKLSVEAYQPYVDDFAPAPGAAAEWARMAKRMGAGYVLLTAKHHDGFCLFDSKLTAYKLQRDLVREYVDAVRAEGLRVGLYYSLVDWHHPDYPAWQDRQHPLRHDPAARERDARGDWARYLRYFHGQVEELCRNYGRIDVFAFDFSYADFVGERWGADELVAMLRRLQPTAIFNDRLSREGIKQAQPPSFVGDLDHVEQDVPRQGIRDGNGRPVPWESWFTVGNSWSFSPHDHQLKQPGDIVRALVNAVSKDGNLMVNIAPEPNGRLPAGQAAVLAGVGDWMARNGESIRGCGAAAWDKPEWGRFTQRGRHLYAHVLEPVIGHVTLPGLRGRVKDGRLVATGAEVLIGDYWNPGVQTFDAPDDIFFNYGSAMSATYPPPDRIDTVVRFTLTDEGERQALLEKYRAALAKALEWKPF